MKHFFKVVAQGLALVLPLILTVWLLFTFATWIDDLLAKPIQYFLGDEYYVPKAAGIGAGIVLAAILGIVARLWLVATFVKLMEGFVRRVPLVKLLYDSIRDMMGFVDSDRKSFTRCVLVKLPGRDIYSPGFVTRETFDDIPSLKHMDDYISVYVSAAYGFMGMLVLARRSDVLPLEMSVGDGLRFVLSGGISASDEEDGAAKTLAKDATPPAAGPSAT